MSDQETPKKDELLPLFRIIDIDSVADPFLWVQATNLLIIILALYAPFELLFSFIHGEVDIAFLISLLLYFTVLGFAAWLAWKNVTVLNSVVQPWTMTSLVTLATFSLVSALLYVVYSLDYKIDLSKNPDAKVEFETIVKLGVMGFMAVVAAISVTSLRHRMIKPLKMSMVNFLEVINQLRIRSDNKSFIPKNSYIGWSLIAGWIIVMVGAALAPDYNYYGSENSVKYISRSSFLMLLFARSRFQPSVEKLLVVDKRQPVLFLRSFIDEAEPRFWLNPEASFVDYSLESRIAEHFFHSGPFIAVGDPKGKHIAFGATRAMLTDVEWQGKVIKWMDDASLIVMFAGITGWTNWELKTTIERGHAYKLILGFPELKSNWFAKDRRYSTQTNNANARLEAVKAAFIDTPWETAMCQIVNPISAGTLWDNLLWQLFNPIRTGTQWEPSLGKLLVNPRCIRSIIFEEDGRLTIVTANYSRNRNIYHLAILISHFLLFRDRKVIYQE